MNTGVNNIDTSMGNGVNFVSDLLTRSRLYSITRVCTPLERMFQPRFLLAGTDNASLRRVLPSRLTVTYPPHIKSSTVFIQTS